MKILGIGKNTHVLELKLCGEFQATVSGTSLKLTNRKSRALLAILALSDGYTCSRERLRGLLWSEIEEQKAQTNLRQCIHILNERVLLPAECDVLIVERRSVTLDSDYTEIDIIELIADLSSSRIPSALLDNPFLLDSVFDGLDSIDPSFQEWTNVKRSEIEEKVIGLVAKIMENAVSERTQFEAASVLSHLKPHNEMACRIQMQSFASKGEIASALTNYQKLWDCLDEAFGEEPSQETQDLAVAIKQGMIKPAVPEKIAVADPRRPRIEISPLDLATDLDNRSERLFAGFRIELLASLVRFREWRICEPSGLNTTLADYQLNLMSVPEAGTTGLLITLKDNSTGEFIWSEKLRRPLDSWVSLQNDVVRRLAVALNIQLSLDRIERGIGYGDFSLEAYDGWLRGEALMMDLTQESWLRAETIFEDVISRTPRFTRGYCGRAGIENMRHLAFPGLPVSSQRREYALNLAREAARIDPIDSRTQLCLGWSNAMLGRFDQAELAFGLAHQHNENDPWTMVSAAIGLAFCDRSLVATALTEQALSLELSPSPIHWSYLAATYFLSGRYEDCIHASIQAQDVSVDVPAWQAAAEAHLGEIDRARATCDRLVKMAGQNWAGEREPDRDAIAEWLGTAFPIRNVAAKHALTSGLAAAGLSERPSLSTQH